MLRRCLLLAAALVLAAVTVAVLPVPAASAAPLGSSVTQCNGVAGIGGGTGAVECSVVVENHLNLATGATSSTVSTIVCVHAANTLVDCGAPTVVAATTLVTTVSQCNGSINVGGGNTLCSVSVVNTLTGSTTPKPATVNQCVGSGVSTTLDCAPVSNTSGAAVTQCNGSGNGGGGDVYCRVDTASTTTAQLPVTVNQCNASSNGGGSTVRCTTSLLTRVVAATPSTPAASVPAPSAPALSTTGTTPAVSAATPPVDSGTPSTGTTSPNPVTITSAARAGVLPPVDFSRLAHTGVDVEPVLNTGIALVTSGLLLVGFATRRRTRAWILRLTETR
ncbi:hypothetical protein [Cryobacterium zhongshanensis]|uniref:LPXTG cell wall anchor domain-containing protein n=1 Tax=Cryobacterium zhongshanensis TaxID=2928153 RepID=A0AA41UHE6_9MICO|nr:hypothetical protein [Cryobacterium zhongshanensis]MCI4659825.1 hypothetical protein [Cryobacterium zhongshanensis]